MSFVLDKNGREKHSKAVKSNLFFSLLRSLQTRRLRQALRLRGDAWDTFRLTGRAAIRFIHI